MSLTFKETLISAEEAEARAMGQPVAMLVDHLSGQTEMLQISDEEL
jgi:hypothetical protein